MSHKYTYLRPTLTIADSAKEITVFITMSSDHPETLSVDEFHAENKRGDYVDLSCCELVKYIEGFSGCKIEPTNCINPINVSEKMVMAFELH